MIDPPRRSHWYTPTNRLVQDECPCCGSMFETEGGCTHYGNMVLCAVKGCVCGAPVVDGVCEDCYLSTK
jgi:hypothetical protein